MNIEHELRRGLFREPSKAVNELSRVVIGAALEVHRVLGPGYVEAIYQVRAPR